MADFPFKIGDTIRRVKDVYGTHPDKASIGYENKIVDFKTFLTRAEIKFNEPYDFYGTYWFSDPNWELVTDRHVDLVEETVVRRLKYGSFDRLHIENHTSVDTHEVVLSLDGDIFTADSLTKLIDQLTVVRNFLKENNYG